ncbi:hypothetical protein [Roseivivax sp. THAF30]|uniref:hypothetical protein n=1 Tax=Roseivivax sp. THAF30 TaxID=2587852 RepID=UPI001267A4B4|nr:hypothetical protein [Roseivivax sp. THAF30]QFT61828.1 hypothetical protein FIU91_02710 [Roseivivax sp. THAF30]
MSNHFSSEAIRFPAPSVAQRKGTTGTPTNCNADCVVDGRAMKVDSHLELTCLMCLVADPNVVGVREQQRFNWYDREGVVHKHYFDFIVDYRSGEVIGYAVRPRAELTAKYEDDLSMIRRQAIDAGFVDDMRVLDENAFDPVTVFNAELLYGSRHEDPVADAMAEKIVRAIKGVMKIEELSSLMGCGGSGFRALVRLFRTSVLATVRHERITPETLVYKRNLS